MMQFYGFVNSVHVDKVKVDLLKLPEISNIECVFYVDQNTVLLSYNRKQGDTQYKTLTGDNIIIEWEKAPAMARKEKNEN